MKLLLLLMLAPLTLFAVEAPCPERLSVTDENDKKLVFCRSQKLMVSEKCAEEKAKCELIKDWNKKKSSIKDAHTKATWRNPGSWVCQELGWKVIMAKNFDGSDTCLCEHPTKERVACTSLIQ